MRARKSDVVQEAELISSERRKYGRDPTLAAISLALMSEPQDRSKANDIKRVCDTADTRA